MRLALAAVLSALALAGCGGNDTVGASAADVVPADAIGFVEVDANLDSEQWRQVQALLDRFPDRPQLLELVNEQLAEEGLEYERDVSPALGPSVAVVFMSSDEQEAVLLTQPDDEDKWRELVRKAAEAGDEEYVLGEIEGWQAAAGDQAALDAVRKGGGSLADNDAFQAALGEFPEERIAFGWAGGEALREEAPQLKLEWFAGALEARDDGGAATVVTRVSEGDAGKTYESERLDDAPADSLAFLSFNADGIRSQAASIAPFAEMLGLPIGDLLAEIQGEAALWVRAGAGIPEITLVLDVADADRARSTLEQLLRDVPLDLKLGVVDGQLVATTASSPEAALEAGGETLGDSADFKDAAEAAGMPGETNGFLFVNVADALPLLGLAGVAGADVPQQLLENLRPIRSVVAWSEADGRVATQHVFVQIQ